jgi:putative hydrolase of the HAD superfamily
MPPPYRAILLDMNGVFMFGQDRFGPAEDYFATYQAQGGGSLTRAEVQAAVQTAHAQLADDYADPARHDDYPSVAEVITRRVDAPAERAALERVFAAHELGAVPPDYAACLHRLAATAPLGIVSNIWARKDPWLSHLEAVGVGGLWRTQVFSSDSRSMKPSPALFRRALADLTAHDPSLTPADVLFIGDTLTADILPAKALGMATAWVGPKAAAHPAADWAARSLLELERALR